VSIRDNALTFTTVSVAVGTNVYEPLPSKWTSSSCFQAFSESLPNNGHIRHNVVPSILFYRESYTAKKLRNNNFTAKLKRKGKKKGKR
jgi:hypothetical protein